MDTLDFTENQGPMDALKSKASGLKLPTTDAIVRDELDIKIEYLNANDVSATGTVTSKINSHLDDSMNVVQRFAALCGGVRPEVMPLAEREYLYQFAWLSVAIKELPPWFQKICAEDPDVVEAVYLEVMAHRAWFLRGFPDDQEGVGAAGQPRIVVSSTLPKGDPS